MAGIHDLDELLGGMSPRLRDDYWVFATVSPSDVAMVRWAAEHALATFREREGLSLIVERSLARDRGLFFEGSFRCITLEIHSALEAVGLTAAVARTLTEANIPANVVAAHFHDHLFVPEAKAEEALEALRALSAATPAAVDPGEPSA